MEQRKNGNVEAIEEACKEETERKGKNTITYTAVHHCDCQVGKQDVHEPIVEASIAITRYLGEEQVTCCTGATNLAGALEAGFPGVCLGLNDGRYDMKIHSLDEQFMPEGAYKGAQQALLLALLCSATELTESIIE